MRPVTWSLFSDLVVGEFLHVLLAPLCLAVGVVLILHQLGHHQDPVCGQLLVTRAGHTRVPELLLEDLLLLAGLVGSPAALNKASLKTFACTVRIFLHIYIFFGTSTTYIINVKIYSGIRN